MKNIILDYMALQCKKISIYVYTLTGILDKINVTFLKCVKFLTLTNMIFFFPFGNLLTEYSSYTYAYTLLCYLLIYYFYLQERYEFYIVNSV